MDPISVIRTLWRHKFILLPVVLVTLIAAAYVYVLGPRTYQSTATFALVNPLVPTEQEILKDPALAKLNANNPYLRSSDNTLIAQVLTTRLGAPEVAKSLEMKGLGTEFTVERAGSFGTGLLIQINATGSSPEQAMETVKTLGEFLVLELKSMQEINGADQRYLFTALAITSGDEATEQFSSRLRSVIMVGAGGAVLLFAAVSAAQALDQKRAKERQRPPRGSNQSGGQGSGRKSMASATEKPLKGTSDLNKRRLMIERKHEHRRSHANMKTGL